MAVGILAREFVSELSISQRNTLRLLLDHDADVVRNLKYQLARQRQPTRKPGRKASRAANVETVLDACMAYVARLL